MCEKWVWATIIWEWHENTILSFNFKSKYQRNLKIVKLCTKGKIYLSRFTSCIHCYCCSVTQSYPTLCDPMDYCTPAFLVLHHLPELAQIHGHWVCDAIQTSRPLSSPSLSTCLQSFQHQGLFQWVTSSHQVAKVFKNQEKVPKERKGWGLVMSRKCGSLTRKEVFYFYFLTLAGDNCLLLCLFFSLFIKNRAWKRCRNLSAYTFGIMIKQNLCKAIIM